MRRTIRRRRWALGLMAGGLGLAAVTYATYVGAAWYRYGHASLPRHDEIDPLLDRFMPEYEVAERHHARVAAPADITLSAAADTDLQQSVLVRAIFKSREWLLGAGPDTATRPKGLLADMQSLGWRVLAEQPGREIVVGAVTQPWMANVTFRGLAPDEFRAFDEPGYVKIVWTLRADPVGSSHSHFPDGNSCGDNGRDGATEVPLVLGTFLRRNRADSTPDARQSQEGSGTPRTSRRPGRGCLLNGARPSVGSRPAVAPWGPREKTPPGAKSCSNDGGAHAQHAPGTEPQTTRRMSPDLCAPLVEAAAGRGQLSRLPRQIPAIQPAGGPLITRCLERSSAADRAR